MESDDEFCVDRRLYGVQGDIIIVAFPISVEVNMKETYSYISCVAARMGFRENICH